MSRLTRRQFLGTSAAAAATLGTPHVWARPAWAQSKELRILAWSHFVPSYDKWIDQFIAENRGAVFLGAVVAMVAVLPRPLARAADPGQPALPDEAARVAAA